MNENLYKTLSELIEHSSHASELLINGEIALNNGELELSQKCNIEAQQLINTMTKDVFVEITTLLNATNDKVEEYDIPNTLELAKSLTKLCHAAASYQTVVLDAQNSVILGIVANKILSAINTVVEIYNAIFNN